MILQKLSQSLKQRDWGAAVIEVAIVVIGIFIGLQVDDWNEARKDRDKERDILLRLHADFQESIAGQSRDLQFLEQQLADQRTLLNALDTCGVAQGDQLALQRAVATLGWVNPPRLYRRTIDEIAASGRTDILQSEAIKAELAAIVALTEWRHAAYPSMAESLNRYREVIEPHVRYDIDRTIENPFVAEHFGAVELDLAAMCQRPELANMVSAVSYATKERLEAYRPLLTDFDQFSRKLVDELARRWAVKIESEETR